MSGVNQSSFLSVSGSKMARVDLLRSDVPLLKLNEITVITCPSTYVEMGMCV